MKKELINYFNSLEDENLPTLNNRYFEDGFSIRKYYNGRYGVGYDNILSYLYGDHVMCVKEISRYDSKYRDVFESVSGDYFNKNGSLSVVGYPSEISLQGIFTKQIRDHFAIATHNLKAIKGIEVCPAGEVLFANGQPYNSLPNDNWYLLGESKLKNYIMKIMTPECFDEFIKLFLADKIGTYNDRHVCNYFFYRRKGATMWEGVIAIDNAMTSIGELSEVKLDDDSFDKFLNQELTMFTPQGKKNTNSHIENLKEINELLQSGQLTSSQIEMLKSIKKYPYEEKLKKSCMKYNIYAGNLYDNVARLWEYNRENLKDL